jgi:hypothetical protein
VICVEGMARLGCLNVPEQMRTLKSSRFDIGGKTSDPLCWRVLGRYRVVDKRARISRLCRRKEGDSVRGTSDDSPDVLIIRVEE